MKSFRKLFFCSLFLMIAVAATAQCSVCTRTAQQMGEKPAKGMNAGILYLAITPLALVGFFSYQWWRKNRTV